MPTALTPPYNDPDAVVADGKGLSAATRDAFIREQLLRAGDSGHEQNGGQ